MEAEIVAPVAHAMVKNIAVDIIMIMMILFPLVLSMKYKKKQGNAISMNEEEKKACQKKEKCLLFTNVLSIIILVIAVIANLVKGNSIAWLGLIVIVYTIMKLIVLIVKRKRAEEELRFQFEEEIEKNAVILPLALVIICMINFGMIMMRSF